MTLDQVAAVVGVMGGVGTLVFGAWRLGRSGSTDFVTLLEKRVTYLEGLLDETQRDRARLRSENDDLMRRLIREVRGGEGE